MMPQRDQVGPIAFSGRNSRAFESHDGHAVLTFGKHLTTIFAFLVASLSWERAVPSAPAAPRRASTQRFSSMTDR